MKAQIEKQHIRVPIELFLDICKMIRTGNIGNKITGSNEHTGEVLLEVAYAKGNKIQTSAIQNIYDVVTEWNEQRYGEESPDEVGLN